MSVEKILGTRLHNGYKFMPEQSVLIVENKKVLDIVPLENAGDDIKIIDGIICPGWINAHCHTELSYLHNRVAKHTGMIDFLLAVIGQRNEATEIIEQHVADGIALMKANYIVAVGDICNTTHSIPAKNNSDIYFKNFIEISGFVPQVAQQRLADGLTILDAFSQQNLEATIVPHAPYSVSLPLLQQIAQQPKAISLHYLESEEEVAFLEKGAGDFNRLFNTLQINIDFKGYGSVSKFNEQLIDFERLLLVHNVQVNAAIIDQLSTQNKQVDFCVCPNANLYIGNPLPDIMLLANSGANICIGTDSLASNDQLNIATEIKTIQQHYPTLPLEQLLQWATINGAKALGLDNQFGSFQKGKDGRYAIFH